MNSSNLAMDKDMLLSEQAYHAIDIELAKYPADQRQSAVMGALRIAQTEKGWINSEIIEDLANYIGMPPVWVEEVATFYNMYNKKPVGKYKITVCTNLPCALREGVATADYFEQKLGIGFGETTSDGLITLQEGECMGACGDSPVLLVNDLHMCVRMNQAKIDEMIAAIQGEGDE